MSVIGEVNCSDGGRCVMSVISEVTCSDGGRCVMNVIGEVTRSDGGRCGAHVGQNHCSTGTVLRTGLRQFMW